MRARRNTRTKGSVPPRNGPLGHRPGLAERYWGDHYVVNDWSVVHLRDPGPGYRWYRDDNGNYVRVAVGNHVIEEVYVR